MKTFSVTIALLIACTACSDPSPPPLNGSWTGLVLLTAPTGVPVVDNANKVTVTMSLNQNGYEVSGTATGIPSGADVSGTIIGATVHLDFGPAGGLGPGSFAGQLMGDSILGAITLTAAPAIPRSVTFRRP